MDLETENHLAALLMEEARRLRRESDKDGVHVYLHKPNVRGRPNSRFLTATVLGVEQANRATEISEMWRAREKERELDAKKKHESKRESKRKSTGMHVRNSFVNDDSRPVSEEKSIPCSFDERQDSFSRGNAGLDDDELEEFLHSRMKRGRGSIGCRMDEPGPYLTSTSTDRDERIVASPIERYGEECMRSRTILGPEKPHFLKSRESHDGVGTSNIQTSKKYHYEEKTKSKREKPENNKTRKESKSKHRKEETNGDHRKSKHKKVR